MHFHRLLDCEIACLRYLKKSYIKRAENIYLQKNEVLKRYLWYPTEYSKPVYHVQYTCWYGIPGK